MPAIALLLPAVAAAQTGTVSGRVTDATSGLPVANVPVVVLTVSTSTVVIGSTNAAGDYSLAVPPGALYYVTTRATSFGHIAQAYPDVPCPSSFCSAADLMASTPFSVAAGGTVTGRDFVIRIGGTIAGRVTDAAGGAVAFATVNAYARFGNQVLQIGAGTNASGDYNLPALHPGTYYLATSNSLGFQNEVFSNVPCVGICSSTLALAVGAPIPVAAGTTVSGQDFALETGGTISGTVTNAATAQPEQNISVFAYTRVGSSITFAGSGFTNAAGQYSITGLAAGTYAIYTFTTRLTNEIHPDILCPLSCSVVTAVDSGTGVDVTLGATVGGVNFALDPGGSISGTITNESTGQPVFASVLLVARFGNLVQTRFASSNGTTGVYSATGLPAGTYVAYTSSGAFLNEVFDNVPCPGACSATVALASGAPIVVAPGAAVTDRNFALQPAAAGGGTISGVVTDAISGLPIAGVGVEVWLRSGSTVIGVTGTSTTTAGTYSFTGLAPGAYVVDTFGNHTFRNEVFDNVPCLSTFCTVPVIATGTSVAVTVGGVATASFGLSAGDGVSGTITDAANGSPLAGVSLSVYQVGSGAFAGSATSNGFGRYFVRGLPNGDYVAFTSSSLGYYNEIHGNIRCDTTCSSATALSAGTRITISGAAAAAGADLAELVSGIDFALDRRDQAPAAPGSLRAVTAGFTTQFTWTAPSIALAAAATSYVIEAGLSPGTTIVTLPATGTSTVVPGVPRGVYYVRVRGVNAFGTGQASNEIRLAVTAGGAALPEPPTSVVAFTSAGLLTMTWTPPASGGPATGYIVEAGSATGAANIATLPVSNPTFSFSPVPAGFYFLRVRSVNAAGVSTPSAEVLIVVGDVAAPPGAPTLNSTPVSESTVTLNWSAPAVGTATSYIIEAGSESGLANLAVVNTGSTALTQSFAGVPSGTYFVRVRAVNALGASVVSNERTVVVP